MRAKKTLHNYGDKKTLHNYWDKKLYITINERKSIGSTGVIENGQKETERRVVDDVETIDLIEELPTKRKKVSSIP